MRVAVLVVIASGCHGAPVHPIASVAAKAAPAPACLPIVKIDLGESGDGTTGQALLDGTDLKLAVDHEAGKSEGEAVVYPHGPHAVLFGWTIYGHYGRPNGSDTLYEVDCTAKTATPFFANPGGDFGHSAMTRDGATTYYSALGGVRALDVATKQTRTVTPRVMLATCGDRSDDQPRVALSAVRSLDDDDGVLIYEDGDNCGFEGDWDGATMYLDHPDKPGGKPYAPRPVNGVVVDAGGAVWASTGTCNVLGLWRSTDRGDHWTRVVMPKPEQGDDEGGPALIVVDAKRPGGVVIETTVCGPAGMSWPHGVAVTRDAGRTWTPLPLPTSDPAVSQPIELRDGSVDHLVAWGTDVAWEWNAPATADDDAGWTALNPVPPAPASALATEATLGDLTFRASPNGLLRSRGHDKPTKLFPQ